MSDAPAHSQRRKTKRSRREGECKMVGNWEIGKTIGKGSSGRVKIARHVETREYAAIKIVSKNALITSRMSMAQAGEQQEKIMLGIEREIVLMKLIDHPNVLSLYDVYETSSDLYLIIEYVEGGELFDYLVSRGRLQVDEALHYFQQIISAMDYCHRFNIAHRDLKPENLLLDGNKNIKVADFGMAAWEGGSDMLETSCGSPHYASPEVVQGKAYRGCTSDIWSCGVILFALLAGRLPFDDENIRVLLEKVKIGKYVMPNDIPASAQDLISRMLEKDVERRITMAEILVHPFFVSRAPRPVPGGRVVEPPSLQEVTRPVNTVADIDPDIFGNLRTLWHGAPEDEIIEGLLNQEKTWEKAVYHLLLKYRARHLEEYDEEIEKPREVATKRMVPPPAVGAPSISTVLDNAQSNALSRPIEASQDMVPSHELPTAPLRLMQPSGPRPPPGRQSLDITPVIQIQAATPEKTQKTSSSLSHKLLPPIPPKSAAQQQRNSAKDHHSPYPPESPMLSPIEVPDLGDTNMQRFFMQIVEHLNTIQPRSSVASDTGSDSRRGSSQQATRANTRPTSECSAHGEEVDDDVDRYADAEEDGTDGSSMGRSAGGSVNSNSSRQDRRTATDGSEYGLGISSLGQYQNRRLPYNQDSTRGTKYDKAGRPILAPLRGSAYGVPYHAQPQRGLSNRQNSAMGPPPPPLRGRSYPLERGGVMGGSYASYDSAASDKENVAPDGRLRSSLAPKPSLKSVSSYDGVERRKSQGDRRVQIVLPGEEIKLKNKRSWSTISESPRSDASSFFIPSQLLEKKSWFGNMFKFKPASYQLLSVYDALASRDECRRLLMNIGVSVTVENTGNLKCRFEEIRDPAGVMAVAKGVRFRVEFNGVTNAHGLAGLCTSVSMVQEKGALSTFKLLYNRLRRDWELDAPPSHSILVKTPGSLSTPGSALPSPALSVSTRYSEGLW